MSQGELSILAEEIIDDDLTLLLAKSDSVPRLGIFNTYSEKKKYVYFSWLEGAERTLKIKVGKKTKEYTMETVVEGVRELMKRGEEAMSLKTLEWRGLQMLGDLFHMTKTARSDADLTLIADNKRDTLWFGYTPKRGKWSVRPCFATTDEEKAVLDKYMEEVGPWVAIPLEDQQMPFTMRNTAVAKEVINSNTKRWTEFMLPVSKALLFGFSDWSTDGNHAFSTAFWKHLADPKFRSEETLSAMASAGKMFMNKMIAYLRIWPVLESIKIEQVGEAVKTGEERGMKKRERFEVVSPHLADRKFKVTRLVEENVSVAFAITPETRLPGEDDRLITLTNDIWEHCLDVCSLGGEHDPQYTYNSILSGIDVKDWYSRICELLL